MKEKEECTGGVEGEIKKYILEKGTMVFNLECLAYLKMRMCVA